MWNEEGMANMSNGLWHWATGFHGVVSLIFMGLIVIGLVLLIRDMRWGDSDDIEGETPTARRRDFEPDGKAGSPRGNKIGPGRHA